MGEKGEGSGGEGGGNWGERGRELGMGYPPVHPLYTGIVHYMYEINTRIYLPEKVIVSDSFVI